MVIMFLKHKVHAIFGGFDKAVQLPSEDEQREFLDLTGQLVLLNWWSSRFSEESLLQSLGGE